MEDERERMVLQFAVVTPLGTQTLDESAAQIGRVIGCSFKPREERGTQFFEASLLGMTIELTLWQSSEKVLLFLHGFCSWATEEHTATDISQAVIDLFEEEHLGNWRLPTREDHDATAEFNAETERLFSQDAGED